MIKILIVVSIVLAVGAGAEAFLLKKSYEQSGALKASNTALQNKLTEVNNVLKEVDKVHSTNTALPDDKLFDGLLPAPAGTQR